jgi:hypothetical protein
MMWPFFTLALAAPPLPTWTAADHGEVTDEDLDDDTAEHADPEAERRAATGRASFAPVRALGHGWADEAALAFDLSGELGYFYYVMATARGGGLVAHWRQGPIAGEDLTRTMTLDVPEDLTGVLAEVGTAHLSLTLVKVDSRDREVGRSRLGRTWLNVVDGAVAGGAPDPETADTVANTAEPVEVL